jgi:eukaryotic-like serine/threonine-protein kinase
MSILDPDRWRAVSPYLDQAAELPRDARAAWLASLRQKDPGLAGDVETLLRDYEAVYEAGFLDEAIGPSADDGPPGSAGAALMRTASMRTASLAGQTLGAYTLVSPIGQGGMGAVWLAARSDGRYEGHAAVKLLNPSLMGPLGQQRAGQERFTREGTILARLRHPSIAQLIDAGVSSFGQPYLVLEYVEGQPIDRYCDDRALGVDARVRLFLEVVTAVAYAHAKLIVHRDIKPSNVLVRTDDSLDVPRVKLLDFGVAKLLESDAVSAADPAMTLDSGWALTPAFAAPEQLTGQPVTTATDVYSLGVLLYLLLSGQHPAGAGLRSPADLIASVVDTDAPRLSATVTDTKTHDDAALAAHAASRNSTPDRLRHALQGDLETIVAKALKKTPDERYATVAALADDLRRVLEQRPISARPDTLRYRAEKFVRRHRIPVALAALAVTALGAGLVGTVTQARRATRQAALAEVQRQRADQEARAAAAQRDFALGQVLRADNVNDLYAFLLSDTIASRPITTVDLLARATHIVDRQQESDENHVEMLITLGRQYWGLEEQEQGRMLLRRAYELSLGVSDLATRARAACAVAPTFAGAGEGDRAERLVQDALSTLPHEPQYALHRVFCFLRGSVVANTRRQWNTSVERVLSARAELKASGLQSSSLEFRIAEELASAYAHVGRHDDALAAFAEASSRLTALGRDDTETAARLYNNWGIYFHLLGRPFDAEPVLRRAAALNSESARARPGAKARQQVTAAGSLYALARTLTELHRWPEAADYVKRAYEALPPGDPDAQADSSRELDAFISVKLGDLGRAARLLAELESRPTRATGPGNASALAWLASELAEARGDLPAAHAMAGRAIALAEKAGMRSSLVRVLIWRSTLAIELDRVEQARADAARALDLERAGRPPGRVSSGRGRAHLALGRALLAAGQPHEARDELSSAVDQLTPTLGADHPETRQARQIAATAAVAIASP